MSDPEEFIITPKSMLLDKRLGKPNLREFYGVVEQLSHRDGYCFASDAYLAKYLSCGKRTVSRWINQLKEYGYIRVEHERGEGGKRIDRRKLYPAAAVSPKTASGYRRIWRDGTAANGGDNNKRIIKKDHIIEEDDYASVGWM